MTDVKRYRPPFMFSTQRTARMEDQTYGDYVTYKDYAALESKLQNQTYLIEQLFHLLDKREETDDGRVFHPNELRSCRAADTEKLNKVLTELRSPMKGQNGE